MGRGQSGAGGFGKGYPISFRCWAARREPWSRDWAERRARLALHAPIYRTGRKRPAPGPGRGHPRKLRESHEYVCACGHVGWSCHSGVLYWPIREPVPSG